MNASRFVILLLIFNTALLLWISYGFWKIFYLPAFQAGLERQNQSLPVQSNPQAQQSQTSQGETAFDVFYNSLSSSQKECITSSLGKELVEKLRNDSGTTLQLTSEETSKIQGCVK